MINMPNDWRDKAFTSDGTPRLPAGGYVCKITGTEIKLSKAGNEGIILTFDIAEGDYKDYFDKNPNLAWTGSMWQNAPNGDPKRDGFFFGMLTAVEESNPGFSIVVDTNGNLVETCLEGKLIGVIFRDEEEEYNGNYYFRARPWQIRSADAIRKGSFKMPTTKMLEKAEPKQMSMNEKAEIPAGFEEINDDDFPF